MKKVLHICSYYVTSLLYKSFIETLDNKKIEQALFVPIKYSNKNKKYSIILKYGNAYFIKLFKNYHRLFFHLKIKKTFQYIIKNITIADYNIIHAHTWFSDGAVAYYLHKKYQLKYIVAVRNTDVNLFYSKFFFLRKLAHNILKQADTIVFISYAYKKKVLSIIPKELSTNIKNKCIVIPNGIDKFWIKSDNQNKSLNNNKINLIYVGNIDKNKNIEYIINLFKLLQTKNEGGKLYIVGYKDRTQFEKNIYKKNNSESIIFVPYTKNKDKIKEYYKKADVFIMPSFKETFGLVYVEAMSQGLPVLYTKEQGFDGYFDDGIIGYPINKTLVTDAYNKLGLIIANYNIISSNCIRMANKFSWDKITDKYIELYNN